MRKYANQPLPGMVLIHRSSCPAGALGPKYRSIGVAPLALQLEERSQRRLALVGIDLASRVGVVDRDRPEQLAGTGCGTVSLYVLPPSSLAPAVSRSPSQ